MNDKEMLAVEPVEDELVDEVVERLMVRADASGAALLGEGGLLTEVTRAVLERALDAEMTEHLGYEKHDRQAAVRVTAATAHHRRPC
ncbi:transposase [Streptomyces albireticuli]|nr:transposase [Streptomyces albireticuli]MCD9146156.1 transposase [Streptomyces albireticuli]MCD9166303.1 transposase [Streptomyces albireticuli]MCD9196630.1 transposase [Streptomyces albireticuli]